MRLKGNGETGVAASGAPGRRGRFSGGTSAGQWISRDGRWRCGRLWWLGRRARQEPGHPTWRPRVSAAAAGRPRGRPLPQRRRSSIRRASPARSGSVPSRMHGSRPDPKPRW